MTAAVAAGTPRVGILGGSFDPVHDAHVALARAALETLGLDRLLWVPAGRPWQKQCTLAAPAHREAMVRLAIEGEPRFVLSRIELEREGPSYTVETVRTLRREQPAAHWYLVIGEDQYAGFHTWHGWQELLASATLAVAGRPGAWQTAHAEVQAAAVARVPLPEIDVSSTEVRARIARGAPIDGWVPPAVARYIARHRLYLEPPAGALPHPAPRS